MQAIFPVALMTTGHSLMTALVVIQGVAGNPELAADIALVQGAALAFFYAFSANARSLVLSADDEATAAAFLKTRLILALPLCLGVLSLTLMISGVALWFALPLVMRRLSEWFFEVAVSELERSARPAFVLPFLILDVAAWLLVAVLLASGHSHATAAMWLWAAVPLSMCAVACSGLLRSRLTSNRGLDLLPHFGSSAVVGVTVYVFRLLIVLLAGKEAGGDLIAAFAIGSLAGTVFGSVVGPSLVLHDQRRGAGLIGRVTFLVVLALLIATGVTALATSLIGEGFDFLGKSRTFWWATVLSLAGGAIMVVAQVLRLNLVQRPGGGSVFGEDVTANVLVVAAVPFYFYLMGPDALGAVYLATAVGALLVYGASNLAHFVSERIDRARESVLPFLHFLLLLPVFVQLESGVFRSAELRFRSGGVISELPIPLSVAACFAGLVLLGRFEAARFAFGFIFFAFVAMLVSGTLATAGDDLAHRDNLILTAQYLLPMFAMAFGQMAGTAAMSVERVARAFLLVVMLIVPVQLIRSWLSGVPFLRPDLGVFSIYQHLQYVPIVLITAFIFCSFALWNRSRFDRGAILVLGPVAGIYAAAAASMLAAAVAIAGPALRAATLSRTEGRAQAIALVLATAVGLVTYSAIVGSNNVLGARFVAAQSGEVEIENVAERISIWRHYLSGSVESVSTIFVGQPRPPDRSLYPSAHNYFLDLLYNFGLVGIAPIMVVILLTLRMCVRSRAAIASSSAMSGLLIAVTFFVLIDNSVKVGLRQPYPGIVAFFLWGLLLARLKAAEDRRSRTAVRSHG